MGPINYDIDYDSDYGYDIMIPWKVNVFSMVAAIRNRKELLLLLLLLLLLVERNRAAANEVARGTDDAAKLKLLYLIKQM